MKGFIWQHHTSNEALEREESGASTLLLPFAAWMVNAMATVAVVIADAVCRLDAECNGNGTSSDDCIQREEGKAWWRGVGGGIGVVTWLAHQEEMASWHPSP